MLKMNFHQRKMKNDFSIVFSQIPEDIRNNLCTTFRKIVTNYSQERWEPSELNGAKFSEVVFRVLEWYTNQDNSYTSFGHRIHPFEDRLRRFENRTNFSKSIRFHIPRMLAVINSLRNDRGVGHVGGDVNPNHMDSVAVVYITKWILAELIRIFHKLPIKEAEKLVEKIVEKEVPIIWEIFNKKRILDTSLKYDKKILIFLYSEYPKSLKESDLFEWSEHSNLTIFRKILIQLHGSKLIEYDRKLCLAVISPKGIKFVENNIKLA